MFFGVEVFRCLVLDSRCSKVNLSGICDLQARSLSLSLFISLLRVSTCRQSRSWVFHTMGDFPKQVTSKCYIPSYRNPPKRAQPHLGNPVWHFLRPLAHWSGSSQTSFCHAFQTSRLSFRRLRFEFGVLWDFGLRAESQASLSQLGLGRIFCSRSWHWRAQYLGVSDPNSNPKLYILLA